MRNVNFITTTIRVGAATCRLPYRTKINFIMTVLMAFIFVIGADAGGRRPPKGSVDGEYAPVTVSSGDRLEDLEGGEGAFGVAAHPSEMEFDTLDWKVPRGDQYRVELKSGPIAYVASDSSLPLVSIEAYIRRGSLADPVGKEGLGSLMSRLLRSGGTAHYPADTLDMLIDLLAMSVSFSQSETHVLFRASFLSEYTDTALHIIGQMLHRPAFEPRRLERERSIMLEGINHRFVNPGPTLNAAYRKHSFAGQLPARLTTEKSLKAITRDDIIKLHKSALDSSVIIMSAAGKFDRDVMVGKLNALFPKPIVAVCPLQPEIAVAPRTRALVVHKPLNQAYVRMGLPLFRRPHPDYYPVAVLNYILGGSGFTSRLGARIRSDEGLTYSIHSRAESNYAYPGTLHIDFFTGTAQYPKAVSIILEELDKAVKDGVTERELDNAVTSLIAELPSSFRSPEDVVSTYAWNEFFGRDADHYEKYPEELRKLTLEDIGGAAKKYVDVNKMIFTIVGDTAAIREAGVAAGADGFFVLDSLKSSQVVGSDSLVFLP